jgi:hypothetical protein
MVIIDFEASSLRRNSHPIEVAWGESPDTVKSFLLNPDYMEGWVDWNPKSADYHGIIQQELRRSGVDPRRVAGRMVDELSGKAVYSDEPRYDRRWKNRLLADSGYDPELIGVRDLNLYLNQMIQSVYPCKTVVEFIEGFSCTRGERHRAAADVCWLIEFVAYVQKSLGKASDPV